MQEETEYPGAPEPWPQAASESDGKFPRQRSYLVRQEATLIQNSTPVNAPRPYSKNSQKIPSQFRDRHVVSCVRNALSLRFIVLSPVAGAASFVRGRNLREYNPFVSGNFRHRNASKSRIAIRQRTLITPANGRVQEHLQYSGPATSDVRSSADAQHTVPRLAGHRVFHGESTEKLAMYQHAETSNSPITAKERRGDSTHQTEPRGTCIASSAGGGDSPATMAV